MHVSSRHVVTVQIAYIVVRSIRVLAIRVNIPTRIVRIPALGVEVFVCLYDSDY